MRKATFHRQAPDSKRTRPLADSYPGTHAASSSAVTFETSADGRRAFPRVEILTIEELAAQAAASESQAPDISANDPHSNNGDHHSSNSDDYDLNDYEDFRHWFNEDGEVDEELLDITQLGQVVQIEGSDTRKRYRSSVCLSLSSWTSPFYAD